MRVRIWSLLILSAGLLAACAAPALPDLSSSEPKSSSAPATLATSIALLPTANVMQRPVVNQVVPLTPTAAALPPTSIVVMSLPAAAPLASPTPGSDSAIPSPPAATTPGDDPAMLEALLVATINQVRAENGLPAYQHSPELSQAARAHSCDLASHGLISHDSSEGRTLAERLAGATPAWEWPSENIAAGVVDPAATVAIWMDEPPEGWHRRNILDVDQREIGVGYCYAAEDPTGNHHYWTADFSRRSTTR